VLPRSYDLDALGSTSHGLVGLSDGTGDKVVVAVHRSRPRERAGASRPPAAPSLVALVHGLGGSAESSYVVATTAGLLEAGYHVARVDLRGAGRSIEHSSDLYHAGRTEDLRDVLRVLDRLPEADSDGTGPALAVMGFSLGGNLTIKLLGEPLDGLPVVAGVAVSAPLDLAVGSEHLHHMAWGTYEKFLLRGLRRDALSKPYGLTAQEREGIRRVSRIVEFDDLITARRNGWRDAAEYYAVNSSGQFLPRIRVPTLVIHALDDPMIPDGPYRAVDWEGLARAGYVQRAITGHGGHVGFHERGGRYPWYVGEALRFLGGLGDAARRGS
jgi:predicted alpha/beta-fold hydrolase